MITLVTELTRRPGTKMADLSAYLQGAFSARAVGLGPHAGVQRFVLSTRIPDVDVDKFAEARGWSAAPDAILQFAFASATQAEAALLAGEAGPLRAPELAALLDEGRLSTFAATEREVFGTMGPAERWARSESVDPPVKMVVQNWKKPDMDLEAFRRHWRDVHGALVSIHGPAMGYRRYVQSQLSSDLRLERSTRAASNRPYPDGGMAEVWWTSQARMKADLATPAAAAASAAMEVDEVNFVDPPRLTAFLAVEALVIGQP